MTDGPATADELECLGLGPAAQTAELERVEQDPIQTARDALEEQIELARAIESKIAWADNAGFSALDYLKACAVDTAADGDYLRRQAHILMNRGPLGRKRKRRLQSAESWEKFRVVNMDGLKLLKQADNARTTAADLLFKIKELEAAVPPIQTPADVRTAGTEPVEDLSPAARLRRLRDRDEDEQAE